MGIYDSLQPVQMPDPVANQGRLMQLMAMQDQAETAGLQRDKMRRDMAKAGRLEQLAAQHGGDQVRLADELQRAGFFDESGKIREAQRKAKVDQATIDEKTAQAGLHGSTAKWREAQARMEQLNQVGKQMDLIGRAMQSVAANPTPDNAEATLASLESQGINVGRARAMLASVGDVKRWADIQMREGMDVTKQLEDERSRWATQLQDSRSRDQLAETGRHNLATEATGRGQLAVSQGQLGLSGARLALDRERHKVDLDRPVYQQTEGGLVAVPGRLAPGQAPTATPVLDANGAQIGRAPKPLPGNAMESLRKAGTAVENTARLRSTFRPEFGGNTIMGSAENTLRRMAGDSTGQAQWWQDLSMIDNQVRNDLFGSALTATELAAWNAAAITPRMSGTEIQKNLDRRAEIEARAASKLARSYAAGGYSQKQIEELLGAGAGYLKSAAPPATGDQSRPVQRPTAAAPQAQQTREWSALPDPREFVGKAMRNERGQTVRSDGKQWVVEK